jgi:hypothetical protein
MSNSHRRQVAKKLKEAIDAATDPMVIAALANQLAKYLPKPKQPRRPRGTQTTKEAEPEIGLDQLVAAMEKKRKGITLTEAEKKITGTLNGGSPEVA